MIKRSPQEIADFFGCYVAQDEEYGWQIYENMPIIVKNFWASLNGTIVVINKNLIDIPEDHDWTKLYSPNVSENPTGSTVSKMENVVGISEKETTREDSAKLHKPKTVMRLHMGTALKDLPEV